MLKRIKKLMMPAGIFFFMLCFITAQANAQPKDIAGHWAQNQIIKWSNLGVVNSKPDGSFKPNDPVTRAELSAMINRIFRYIDKSDAGFNDIKGNEWYANDINIAYAAGYLKGSNGHASPLASVTRQEAATMFARAFELEPPVSIPGTLFKDAGQIAGWAKDAVETMAAEGYISGRPGNIFAPTDKMSRAEAVKIIDNLLGTLVNTPGKHTFTVTKNAAVNTSGAEISNAIINGNLYITQGIGSGEVNLNNCEIKGSIYIKGGGEHSIIINNTRVGRQVLVEKKDGLIRVVAMGTSSIPEVTMKSGGWLQNNAGSNSFTNVNIAAGIPSAQKLLFSGVFGSVNVEASGLNMSLSSGKILTLFLQGAGISIDLAEGTSIDDLILNAAARVNGKGKVTQAQVNAEGVTMEYAPEQVVKKDTVKDFIVINPKEDNTGSNGENQDDNTGSNPGDNTGTDGPGNGNTGDVPGNSGTGDSDSGNTDGNTPDNPGTGDIGGTPDNPGTGEPGSGTPGGGTPGQPGSGPVTPAPPKVLSASVSIGSQNISASDQGNGTWMVNLSSVAKGSLFHGVSVTATPDTKQAVVSCMGLSSTLAFSNGSLSAGVSDLLKDYDVNIPISIDLLKLLGMTSISVVLSGDGGTTSISVQLNY